MPTATYDLIAEGSPSSGSITFSSIVGTYKDLVVETLVPYDGSLTNIAIRFNSDTGANYSNTFMRADGVTASSSRSSNATYILNGSTVQTVLWVSAHYAQIMSYANTNVFKTMLSRETNGDPNTTARVGLWRSTNAITSVTIIGIGASLPGGTVARLWGIA